MQVIERMHNFETFWVELSFYELLLFVTFIVTCTHLVFLFPRFYTDSPYSHISFYHFTILQFLDRLSI
jgi:hypothetical protein